MTREKVINDVKFRQRCMAYGLDWENCIVFDNAILLFTSTNGLYILFDENYNTICIEKNENNNIEQFVRDKYYEYSNFVGKMPFEEGFGYPFEKFTLKDIIDLSNKIEIIETNHGHSSCIKINDELYERNFENGEEYFQLLSYIKFLDEEIKLYFLNYYHMVTMGFEVPNIYDYVKALIKKLNNCIDFHLEHNRRPWPSYILSGLGKSYKEFNMDIILFDIANLLMKEKGYKVRSNSPDEIEKIELLSEKKDLSLIAEDLLKILNICDEELKVKSKNR